ncbi:MAG: hypothetical protein AAB972_04695 [Patescibacteria group bacterium]
MIIKNKTLAEAKEIYGAIPMTIHELDSLLNLVKNEMTLLRAENAEHPNFEVEMAFWERLGNNMFAYIEQMRRGLELTKK